MPQLNDQQRQELQELRRLDELEKKFGQAPAEDQQAKYKQAVQGGLLHQLERGISSGVGAVERGALAIPELLGDTAMGAERLAAKALGHPEYALQSTSDAADKLLTAGGMPKPNSLAGEILQGAGAVGTGAALGKALPALGHLAEDIPGQLKAITGGALGGRAAEALGLGPAAQFVSSLVGGGIPTGYAAGKNAITQKVQDTVEKELNTPHAIRGKALESQFGPMTAGQLTGAPMAEAVEDVLRRNAATRERFVENETQQINTALDAYKHVLDSVHPEGLSATGLGSQVMQAFDALTDRLINQRSTQASSDFAKVNELAGNEPILQINNTIVAIDEAVKRRTTISGGTPETGTLQELKRLRDAFTFRTEPPLRVKAKDGNLVTVSPEKPGMLTASEFQNELHKWGRASVGKERVFTDLVTASERDLSREIYVALQKDLDAAAGQGGKAAEALKTARDNYRDNSNRLNQIEKSTIGAMLGRGATKTPVKVAGAFLNMGPKELNQTVDLLRRHDPEILQKAQRYFLQRILDRSMARTSEQMIEAEKRGVHFMPGKAVSALGNPKEAERFATLFGSADAQTQINDLVKYMARITPKAQGSQTYERGATWHAIKGLRHPLRSAAAYFASNKLADMMIDPGGRQALLTLAKSDGKPSQNAAIAAAYLNSVYNAFGQQGDPARGLQVAQ